MALSKSFQTPFGVAATYHHIGILNIHPRNNSVQVVIDSFVSAQTRTDGAAPMQLRECEVSLPFTAALADGGRAAVYAAIKALPAWAGATDC